MTVALAVIGLVAASYTIVSLVPAALKKYAVSAIVATLLIGVFASWRQNLDVLDYYTEHALGLARALTGVVAVVTVVLAVVSRSLMRAQGEVGLLLHDRKEQFLHKEYSLGGSVPGFRVSIDGRRHAGKCFFSGRCLVLPAGRYRIAVDSEDPGGWSAWPSDDDPNAAPFRGAWTWNLLISIPGVTPDFAEMEYRANESYHRALKLGRWEEAWVFKSRERIDFQILQALGFATEVEVSLPTALPVWFWLWDHEPSDNRGSVNVRVAMVQ